jgi:hypothetical protein
MACWSIAKFPFKTLLGAILCCYVVVEKQPNSPLRLRFPKEAKELNNYKTEFYPLSAFPMYSTFAERVFCLGLTDTKDQPIRLLDIPGATASAITKDYNQRRDRLKSEHKVGGKDADLPLELRQAAGKATLGNLMTNLSRSWFAARPQERFRLLETMIYQENGKTRYRDVLLTEASFADFPSP